MLFHHFLVLLFQTKISKWLILTDFDRRLSNRLSENKPDTMTMPDRISKNMTTKLSVFMLIECPAAGIDHSKYEVGRFHIFCRLGKQCQQANPQRAKMWKSKLGLGSTSRGRGEWTFAQKPQHLTQPNNISSHVWSALLVSGTFKNSLNDNVVEVVWCVHGQMAYPCVNKDPSNQSNNIHNQTNQASQA